MLFQPQVLVQEPLKVLATVAIIMAGKTVAAIGLVLAFRYPLNTSLTVGASLAQIGEFSFILAGLGVALGLLPIEGQSLILAGALISIALNSLVFAAIEPAQRWIRARSVLARNLERSPDPLAESPRPLISPALPAKSCSSDTAGSGDASPKSSARKGSRTLSPSRTAGSWSDCVSAIFRLFPAMPPSPQSWFRLT